MAMKNFRMLWDNHQFDAATLTATTSASGYPVTCLQDQFRSRKWRTTSIIEQYITIDFGTAINFNSIAFIDHNLSTTGTIRIMASNTPLGSDLLDMNILAYDPLIGFGEDGFGYFGFGGYLLEIDRSWIVPNPIKIFYFENMIKYGTGLYYGNNITYGTSIEPSTQKTTTARYLTIKFKDDNNPDGYIELGRLFICRYANFNLNFDSIVHGTIDESEIYRSLGGQAWIAKKTPLRRTMELNFDVLEYADKYWNLKFMVEKMGITESYLIDCFPSIDLASQHHHSILYGRFQDLPSIEQNSEMPWIEGIQVSSTGIIFEEEIT